jgi:hypothetical protein
VRYRGASAATIRARLGQPRDALTDARGRAEEQHIVEKGIGERRHGGGQVAGRVRARDLRHLARVPAGLEGLGVVRPPCVVHEELARSLPGGRQMVVNEGRDQKTHRQEGRISPRLGGGPSKPLHCAPIAGGRVDVEHEAVGVSAGCGTRLQGHPRPVNWNDVAGRPRGAVGRPRAPGEHGAQGGRGFLHHLAWIAPGEPGLAHHGAVVRAEAEDEPLGGDLVDGHGGVAEHPGMAHVHVGDIRAEEQAIGARRHHRDRRHAVVAERALDHEQIVESRLFHTGGQIHGLSIAKTESPQRDSQPHA